MDTDVLFMALVSIVAIVGLVSSNGPMGAVTYAYVPPSPENASQAQLSVMVASQDAGFSFAPVCKSAPPASAPSGGYSAEQLGQYSCCSSACMSRCYASYTSGADVNLCMAYCRVGCYYETQGLVTPLSLFLSPPNQAPIGALGIMNDKFAFGGWAFDNDTPLSPLVVEIDLESAQGHEVIKRLKANLTRLDINKLGYPGNHGFWFQLPLYLRSGVYAIRAYALDAQTGERHMIGVVRPTIAGVGVLPAGWVPGAANRFAPVGGLGVMNDKFAFGGWTADNDTPLKSLTVEITKQLGSGPEERLRLLNANLTRLDINKLGYPGNHGFWFQIPVALRNTTYAIRAYAIDAQTGQKMLLRGSPRPTIVNASVMPSAPSIQSSALTMSYYANPNVQLVVKCPPPVIEKIGGNVRVNASVAQFTTQTGGYMPGVIIERRLITGLGPEEVVEAVANSTSYVQFGPSKSYAFPAGAQYILVHSAGGSNYCQYLIK